MTSSGSKQAVRRLMTDQEEIRQFPVENVSAAPLDSNFFEWHCNIKSGTNIFHVILYFPDNYPYSSPSAEFVPSGLDYTGGAIERGKKGDKICLSIFSDFANIHREWAAEEATGWSPGYTAQTVLLNLVSFLAENDMTSGTIANNYQRLCRRFTCDDCGHTFSEPFPSLDSAAPKAKDGVTHNGRADQGPEDIRDGIASQIVDYISKEKFQWTRPPSRDDLFGYGLQVIRSGRKISITTPCEFLTASTFYGMKKSCGTIHSVMKRELSYFLPLYINKLHGSQIRENFQQTLSEISSLLLPQEEPKRNFVDAIIQLIPNLMCSTVVEFSKGLKDTSENSLQGYFALHRLFLWAMEIYPELETRVEERLSTFVSDPARRNKQDCPDIGQWLMLLSASTRFSWTSVAEPYLSESFKRNVMWYIQKDQKLADPSTPKEYRLKRTFELTDVSRNLLMFQVAFLKIAKPEGMDKSGILDRYEMNLGFPTQEMVREMKTTCRRIDSEITDYAGWYSGLGLPTPSADCSHNTLLETVRYANATQGYHFTQSYARGGAQNGTQNGPRNGTRGGRGGRRR